MAWMRIGFNTFATVVGGLFSWVFFALNGYESDPPVPPWHTLWIAIPLVTASAAVGLLTVVAAFSASRREEWSWRGLYIVLVTVPSVVSLVVLTVPHGG
jgi:Kef-type K+ transport system membrane component KefB